MKVLKTIAKILVIILVPVFLLMTSIRILITPLYPQVEYQMPGFPADPFGFSAQERLAYARVSVDYLSNAQPISFLGDLKMKDGTPLYNDRELSHMLDVKNLVQAMIKAWFLILVILLFLWLIAWRTRWLGEFFSAVRFGGWATMGLIGLIILSTFLNFDALFTDFHRIFFTGDTWLFYTSDSLIRLFPERFWSDAFLYIGVLTILFSLGAIFGGIALSKRLSNPK
jgi:integral membrane protein (TIGR01906 family)